MIVALRRRRDFALLSADGTVRSAGPLRVRWAPDEGLGAAHIAFALPRSVGCAVVRNRIRRQLREILRQLDRDGRIDAGRYLMVVTPRATEATFDELQRMTRKLVANRAA